MLDSKDSMWPTNDTKQHMKRQFWIVKQTHQVFLEDTRHLTHYYHNTLKALPIATSLLQPTFIQHFFHPVNDVSTAIHPRIGQ